MSSEEYHDYEVEIHLNVTAPSLIEAEAALDRSGLTVGALIGECLIETREVSDR